MGGSLDNTCSKLVDWIDCSSGGNIVEQKIDASSWGYQVPISREVRARAGGILTGAIGRITEPWQAERVLASGAADIVSLGQQFLREPNWPYRAARELGHKMHWAPQYDRARM